MYFKSVNKGDQEHLYGFIEPDGLVKAPWEILWWVCFKVQVADKAKARYEVTF